MTGVFERKRSGPDNLIGALDKACAILASSAGRGSPLDHRVQGLRERLRSERLQIAVLGQFKRGKSTFINALLGQSILPTAVVPLTAVATFIGWREQPLIRVQFTERPAEEFTGENTTSLRDILTRFVSEEANPENRLGVERVDLLVPAPILADGTVLIDTPGIGSTLAHNTETALRVIPECDASLFIVSSDPPITEVELAYLNELKPKVGHIFFVMNKIDYVSADELHAVTAFLRKVLADNSLIDKERPIFEVSARRGLSAKEANDTVSWAQSGMAAVEYHLLHYLAAEKIQSLRDAIVRKARDAISQGIMELELRTKALKMPIQELEKKSSEFNTSLRSIEAQRLTVADLLSGDRRRLVADLEVQTRKLRDNALSFLTVNIDNALANEVPAWEDAIKSAVATAMEDFFTRASEQFISTFSKRADKVFEERRQNVDNLIQEVRRSAAAMFSIPFVAKDDLETFQLRQDPYWVTERIASSLIPRIGGLFDCLLPIENRRRRRHRRIVAEASELIIRNAESLRWAVLRGLDETFRGATEQIEERLGNALAATKGVIEDALSRRREHSFTADAAIEQVKQSQNALTDVLADLE